MGMAEHVKIRLLLQPVFDRQYEGATYNQVSFVDRMASSLMMALYGVARQAPPKGPSLMEDSYLSTSGCRCAGSYLFLHPHLSIRRRFVSSLSQASLPFLSIAADTTSNPTLRNSHRRQLGKNSSRSFFRYCSGRQPFDKATASHLLYITLLHSLCVPLEILRNIRDFSSVWGP